MTRPDLHHHLEVYLSVREALGFQMRAARTLLRDFVEYVEHAQIAGPVQAQLAVDWACASSSLRMTCASTSRLAKART